MTKTIIRRATSADFAILLEIDTSCFPEGIAYDSHELSWFMNRKGAETIVLERDGSIAGFLIIEVDSRNRSATIVTLDVQKDFRRLGYGLELLRRSEEIAAAHQASVVRLQVDVHNSDAVRFYETHGYQKVRRLNHYYTDGHDAWLMIKTLQESAGK